MNDEDLKINKIRHTAYTLFKDLMEKELYDYWINMPSRKIYGPPIDQYRFFSSSIKEIKWEGSKSKYIGEIDNEG